MKMKTVNSIALMLFAICLTKCISEKKESHNSNTESFSDIRIVGAMKNVMWKGELGGNINFDTISNKVGLYGLGPVSYLKGELLINNGKVYVSTVKSDSTMSVEQSADISAPFFVYTNVHEWNEIALPQSIKSIQDLESFITEKTTDIKRPFAFKLIGAITRAVIHIQNLPEGTLVSSPTEAHQGQVNYELEAESVDIVGFYSTKHKGVFTHHDSFLHMYLITSDESKMGHLDEVVFESMKLYLPRK